MAVGHHQHFLSVFSAGTPLYCLGTLLCTGTKVKAQPEWHGIVGSIGLASVSTLLMICVVRLLGDRSHAGAGDWSCVIAWRSLAGIVLRVLPLLLVFALLRAKRTRVLTLVSALAIAFDCVLIDMMA
jgi:hypothetical protein